jgi:hypothetical protein
MSLMNLFIKIKRTNDDTSGTDSVSSNKYEQTQIQDQIPEENLKELATILLNLNSQKTSKNAEKNEENLYSQDTTMPPSTNSYNDETNIFSKENANYFSEILNDTEYSSSTKILTTTTILPEFDNKPKQTTILNNYFQLKDEINEALINQSPMKFRNKAKNKSLSNSQFSYSFLKQIHDNVKNTSLEKIDTLLINFDHIDLKSNTLEVSTSNKNTFFAMKITNRTDIFKGVKNGAVYLHSKTSFSLNLNEYASDFCLTSSFFKPNLFKSKNKKLKKTIIQQIYDSTCDNGWTVSFWIKVTNLNLFDKTILKVDNLINNQIDDFSKFFVLKLSNFDIKIQFLYKKKLWTVNQNIMWKSEWTMLTLTWSEFEGITVYLNDKKLLCQQMYEYYNVRDDADSMNGGNKNDNLFLGGKAYNFENNVAKEAAFEKLRKRSRDSAALAGLIYIGLNNNVNRYGRKFFWSYRDESSNTQQNVLLASTFSEAILLDEMVIINYKISSKDIMQIYLKGMIRIFFYFVVKILLASNIKNKFASYFILVRDRWESN